MVLEVRWKSTCPAGKHGITAAVMERIVQKCRVFRRSIKHATSTDQKTRQCVSSGGTKERMKVGRAYIRWEVQLTLGLADCRLALQVAVVGASHNALHAPSSHACVFINNVSHVGND